MSGCLDRFPTALREYETVSADSAAVPTASDQTGHVRTLAVDVRRFPWIRPLVGRLRVQFSERVEGLYSGNPTDAQAWKDAVARAQQHPRNRSARLPPFSTAQQNERNAPVEARAAAAQLATPTPSRSSRGNRRARSAGRSSHC